MQWVDEAYREFFTCLDHCLVALYAIDHGRIDLGIVAPDDFTLGDTVGGNGADTYAVFADLGISRCADNIVRP